MRIVCLVKFVPDVDSFTYDYETSTLSRDSARLILNPDDACALAFALKLKASNRDHREDDQQDDQIQIEVLSMGPKSVIPHMEDLLRLKTDKGTLLSDPAFAGSDTYATSLILARYLAGQNYDCILTGTHAIDGDTAHVPAQIAQELDLDCMVGITGVDEQSFSRDRAVFEIDHEHSVDTWEMSMPCVLGLSRESGYKLPYPAFEDFQKDVASSLQVLTREDLDFNPHEVGQQGSLTKVVRTYKKTFHVKEKILVKNDEQGIDLVFNYLKQKGFLES